MPSRQTDTAPVTLTVPTPFPVGPVNVYLLSGPPLTLIDTGAHVPACYEALSRGLGTHGAAIADLERVILTHHHLDHSGLVGRIQDESRAEVCAHPQTLQERRLGYAYDDEHRRFFYGLMIELGAPPGEAEQVMSLWDAYRHLAAPFTVDHVFEDGGAVGPFTTYFVPGHSATDTLLVHRADHYSLTGDHILENINPNPLIRRPEPGQARPKSLVEYQQSLRHSRALELGRCFPAHGIPFVDHRRVIDRILAQHERKIDRIPHDLGDAGITPYALATHLYPRMRRPDLYLCLSLATGQLEVLEDRGLMRSEHRNGILHFFHSVQAAPCSKNGSTRGDER